MPRSARVSWKGRQRFPCAQSKAEELLQRLKEEYRKKPKNTWTEQEWQLVARSVWEEKDWGKAPGQGQKGVKRSRDNAVVSAVGDIVARRTQTTQEQLLESEKQRLLCSSAVGDVVAAGPLVRHDDATGTKTPSIPEIEKLDDGTVPLLAASTLSLAPGSSVCLAALAKPEVASEEPRVSKIGEGSFSAVYKAVVEGQTVALKVCKKDSTSPNVTAEDRREHKVLMDVMGHRNVVLLLEAERRSGKIEMVFEYCDQALAQYLLQEEWGSSVVTACVCVCVHGCAVCARMPMRVCVHACACACWRGCCAGFVVPAFSFVCVSVCVYVCGGVGRPRCCS